MLETTTFFELSDEETGGYQLNKTDATARRRISGSFQRRGVEVIRDDEFWSQFRRMSASFGQVGSARAA